VQVQIAPSPGFDYSPSLRTVPIYVRRAITVGNTQQGTLTATLPGYVNFPVTTEGIADGTYSVNLSAGTPAGISASTLEIKSGAGKLYISTNSGVSAGTHSISVSVGSVTSNKFNVVVSPASTIPVCEIVETGVKYAYLYHAYWAAGGKTIRLLDNINYDRLEFDEYLMTFDLNGKTLTLEDCTSINGSNVKLTGAGALNVTNSVDIQSGAVMITNATCPVVAIGRATVLGNVTSGGLYALGAARYGKVNVNGNVTLTNPDGVGAIAENDAQITVDGTLTVPAGATYIRVGTTDKTKSQYETVTTKPGYFTYTDGNATVWVRSGPSDIDVIAGASLKVWTQNGALFVAGLTPDKPWSVYDIFGRMIYRGIAGAGETLHVAPLPSQGVYIITHENQSVKAVY